MNLEELNVYQLSMELGDSIWNIVKQWNHFEKDTLGKQLVRSSDSVAANISEGYGRFSFKENKQFVYYSRGSLYETKTWLTKVKNRQLINTEEYLVLISKIEQTGKMLNNYIKSIGAVKPNDK